MWYRHIIYKIPDKRGCSLLTQPTFPFFFVVCFQSHTCDRHDKMASGFGNDHDIKRRNEMLHP